MPDMLDQLNTIKPKCQRCNWSHGGFHICVDLSTPEPSTKKLNRNFGPRSEEYRKAISEGQLRRYERMREANSARDNALVERYKEGGVGYHALAKEFGLSKHVTLKILKRAEAEGRVKMRPKGHTIAKGAE